jgi:hypothetical protein
MPIATVRSIKAGSAAIAEAPTLAAQDNGNFVSHMTALIAFGGRPSLMPTDVKALALRCIFFLKYRTHARIFPSRQTMVVLSGGTEGHPA